MKLLASVLFCAAVACPVAASAQTMLNPGHNDHPELSQQFDRDHDRGRGHGDHDRDDHDRGRHRGPDRDRDGDDRRPRPRPAMWQCWSQDRYGRQYSDRDWNRWEAQTDAHRACERMSWGACWDLGCNQVW